MKILQLNVWNGRIKGALVDFLVQNPFDLICMQEVVWLDEDDKGVHSGFFATLDDLKKASGLNYDLRSINWTLDSFMGHKLYQGNVILSREKIIEEKTITAIDGTTELKAWQNFYDHRWTAQRIKLESGLNVVNYHGYWQKQPLGNEDTVKAMKNVAALIKEVSGPLVVCGDFNVIYDSPAMRELDFLRDLTEENHIDNTLAGLKYGGKVACDHILVNENIEVVDFQVVEKIISDHKGLIVEIG